MSPISGTHNLVIIYTHNSCLVIDVDVCFSWCERRKQENAFVFLVCSFVAAY